MNSRLSWLILTAALSSAAPATETTTFTYDALGRLVQSSNAGGPRNGLSSGTGYDPAGNRTASSTNQALPAPPANAAVFSISGPAPLDEGGLAGNYGDTWVITVTRATITKSGSRRC